MAVSLGGGTAFLCVVQSVFHVIKPVLPLQYCSTFLKVLEYFLCSTVVLSWKYWSVTSWTSTGFMKE